MAREGFLEEGDLNWTLRHGQTSLQWARPFGWEQRWDGALRVALMEAAESSLQGRSGYVGK